MSEKLAQSANSSSSSTTLDSIRSETSFTIRNRARRAQKFLLFKQAPAFASSGVANANLTIPSVLHTTAYQASRFVAPETGSATFILPSEVSSQGSDSTVFVVTGCSLSEICEGKRLFPSDYIRLEAGGKEANLPSGCVMTMQPGWDPSFKKSSDGRQPYSPPGKIRIDVDHSFRHPNADHPFVGIGALSSRNPLEIVPLITWEAIPGCAYLLKPDDFWHCASGKATPGTVIDLSDWVEKADVELPPDELQHEVIFEWNETLTKVI